ncbi:hypothetical protein [Noviherbaspirillum malthae]|uniref:hypothetical protein n=1 Tax=Noviherbaspirillum malthae TaxID=1260987 RepID=UPI001E351533|nr:hypothetical protein [Noviherbaspirillum malthae]
MKAAFATGDSALEKDMECDLHSFRRLVDSKQFKKGKLAESFAENGARKSDFIVKIIVS